MHATQTLVLLIAIPLPLFFAQTVYGVGGLTAWVVIGMIWAFCSAISVVVYPLYESRAALALIGRGIIKVRVPAQFPQSGVADTAWCRTCSRRGAASL